MTERNNGKAVAVAIGEMVVSRNGDDTLVAYGLGSCVAVCLFDPVTGVGGMLHALLPTPPSNASIPMPNPRFVDQGVPLLVTAVLKQGARRSRLIVTLCGGGQVLASPGFDGRLRIGERNVAAAEIAIQKARLHIRARSTGGTVGRTVKFYLGDGRITVRTFGQSEKTLYQGTQVRRRRPQLVGV